MRCPLLLVFIIAGVLAAPSPVHVVHERRRNVPKQWTKHAKLETDTVLPVRIGLKQSNLHKGHELLMDISKHDSPRYGQHYSTEEVISIFAPTESTTNAVNQWLVTAGIDQDRISQSVNKQWLQFDASTKELEGLLRTEYYVYEHTSGKTTIACDKYHVPSHVRGHIDYITPGIKLLASTSKRNIERPSAEKRSRENARFEKRTFGITGGKGNAGFLPPLLKELPMALTALMRTTTQDELEVCDQAITPRCVKALYNITQPTTAVSGNTLGIFEDLGDKYSQTDLDLFWASFSPNIPVGTGPTLDSIDGATAPASPTTAGAESDLDFQISYPIIYPQGTTLFQTDDDYYENNYTYEGFFNNFLDAIDGSYCTFSAYGETGNSPLDPPYPDPNPGGYKGNLQCGVYTPTNVISISYGGQEADLPASYQQRQCAEFMKLGLQGISIVLASGDSGVAGPSGDDNANGCLGPNANIFSPDFPATCPYLTTVGATYLPPGANASTDSEVAVTRFPSGGGFSNIYPIPEYQVSAVAKYLNNYVPDYPYYSSVYNNSFGANGGIYNRAGRGYPDVSAVGDNVVIFYDGTPTLIGGTSASAPVFASILTRINEERLLAGKSTVGFVNPVLYANPQVFRDVTVGSNPGCGTEGFTVSPGWDPVTGLGGPDFPKLLDLFMGLP